MSGIPPGTKSAQLAEIFTGHGKVVAIKIIRGDNNTLLGFVKLENIDQANRCMEKLDQCEFKGNRISISKERPISKEKDDKVQKIGFRSSKKFEGKPHRGAPISTFKSHRINFRGGPPKSFAPRFPPRRNHHEHPRRQEIELERERQKFKLERIKFERDRAELLKLRESRIDRDRIPFEEKRITPVKRGRTEATGFFEHSSSSYINDSKRFDEFNRREDFQPRRYDSQSSTEKKFYPRSFTSSTTRPRFDDHNRQDRFSDTKHDSSRNWQLSSATAPKSWINTGTASGSDRWPSTSYNANARVISNISSNPIHRLHSNSDFSHISKSEMRDSFYRRF